MTTEVEITKKDQRLDAGFSVFNCHLNDAKERADKEFIAQFGQEAFDKHIAPVAEAGIMSIFNDKPTQYTAAWVALVTAYVNENRLPRSDFDACGYRSKSGKTSCGALRYYHDQTVKGHDFVEPLSAHVASR